MLKDLLGIVSLLGFVVVSILCLISAKFGSEWASRMMDTVLPQIVQCWIINVTVIIQYHYGTSASSQRKSETILKMLPGKNDCIDEQPK